MHTSKWGNSLAVRLPKALAVPFGLEAGDDLEIVEASKGRIAVLKADRRAEALARLDRPGWLPLQPRRGQRAVSVFFDTNLLVYAQQHVDKADRARALLAGGGALSVQVINEFAAVAHRKQGKDWEAIEEAIDDVLALVGAPQSLTLATNKAVHALVRAHGFAFYDAPIIAAALEAGCDTLFSEDIQNGRKIGALTIVNPFTPEDHPIEA